MPDKSAGKVSSQALGFEISLGEDGVLRARFHRNPDLALLQQLLEKVDQFGRTPLRLLDCRGTIFDITMQEQIEISDFIRSKDRYRKRTAFLVDNVMSFARLRQFMSYREDKEVERQVFRDEGDALAWLLEKESDSANQG